MAAQWLYIDIFNIKFNISFKQLASDICDVHDEYLSKLKGELYFSEKNVI